MGWEEDQRRQDDQRRKSQEEDRKRTEARRQQQLKAQRDSDHAKRVAAALAKKRKEEQEELLEKRRELAAQYDNAIAAENSTDQANSDQAPKLNRGLSNGLGGFAPPRLSANARSKPGGNFQSNVEAEEGTTSLGTASKAPTLPPLRRYGL